MLGVASFPGPTQLSEATESWAEPGNEAMLGEFLAFSLLPGIKRAMQGSLAVVVDSPHGVWTCVQAYSLIITA